MSLSKKFLSFLLPLLMLISFIKLPASATEVSANCLPPEPTTEVTVHKIKMTTLEGFPKSNPNAQAINNIQNWFGKDSEELGGILFNYYRVDGNSSYAKMSDSDLVAVSESVLKSKSGVINKGSFYTTTGGWRTNLENGRYIFYESESNASVIDSMAVPFVLNLPTPETNASGNVVYNSDGTIKYLTSMHVYPKNITQEPSPSKSVTNLGQIEESAKVGDNVQYLLTTTIPKTIAKYTQFNFVDNLEPTLDYVGNVQVNLGGTTMTGNSGTFNFNNNNIDYYITEPSTNGGGTLIIKFTQSGLNKMANNLSSQLIVKFNAKINETAKVLYTTTNEKNDEITNNFDIKYKNTATLEEKTKPSNNVYVYIGGKTFIKTNEYNTNDPLIQYLQGATFDLYFDDNTNTKVTWTTELIQLNTAIGSEKFGGTIAQGQPIVLKSGSDGKFEIKGLRANTVGFDGKYKLVETTPPTGYIKLNSPVNFIITKDGFKNANTLQIKNTKQPNIPQTGGIGSIIFLAAGLLIMGSAVVALKRKKKLEN